VSKSDKAAEMMGAGYNCAQAVSTTYGTAYGVPEETIARMATGFGGGIGRTDNICGAVSGAIMVLGLRFGAGSPDETDAKTRTSIMAAEFIKEFTRRYGAASCTGLLGYNMSVPGEAAKASAANAFAGCRDIVRNAGNLLEEFLQRE